MLREVGITVQGGIREIAGIKAATLDFAYAPSSEIYALDPEAETAQKAAISEAKEAHDSVGGVAAVKISGMPAGLGEPLYYKLDALLADAMMGINAVKAVEIGDGFESVSRKGSENNDPIRADGFASNHSGGILGGISNGEDVLVNVYFKPTPSIFKTQQSVDVHNHECDVALKGRHDPCVAPRGSVVAEAMAALVVADLLLLNMGRTAEGLKRYYAR